MVIWGKFERKYEKELKASKQKPNNNDQISTKGRRQNEAFRNLQTGYN
jgi:hypothetical protein